MLTTVTSFIYCSNCFSQITSFYTKNDHKICQLCLIKLSNKNSFPKGQGCYEPCKLCKEPSINWYYKPTYGKIATDCGEHEETEEAEFNIFD